MEIHGCSTQLALIMKMDLDMTDKNLRRGLELMVKADKAKVLDDGDYAYYVVASPKELLNAISGIDVNSEDEEYIILSPGEKIDWFVKGYA